MKHVFGAVFLSLAPAAAASEVYGNFETMGVVADCPAGRRPAEIGRVKVYLLEGEEKRPVQDALQVGSENYYASSIFFLAPGKSYRVLVEFEDKAGQVIHEERLSGATRPEIRMPSPARRIFVSPQGNDGAAGTEEAPMRTVSAALAKASAGTAVVLRGGVYYEGDISWPVSGTAEAPVMLAGYPGEQAVLDGSEPALLETEWEAAGEGLFGHAFEGETWLVALEEKATGKVTRVLPMPSLADLRGRSSGGLTFEQMRLEAAYYSGGGRITLMPPKPDMRLYRVHVAARTRAFNIEGRQNVFMDNVGMRYYGRGMYGAAVFVYAGEDVVIQRCRIEFVNTGIWVKDHCRRVTVQDNTFFDDLNRWHFGYVKSRGVNYHGHIESGFVYCDGSYWGRGLVVRRNRVENLFDGAHLAADSNASRAAGMRFKTQETDFYQNEVIGCCDDFIEVDGYARNVRIFENRMTNCLSGVSIAQALDGPTWVLYNAICGFGIATGATMERYEGYPVKSNGGLNTDIGSGYVVFYHNTSWTPHRTDSAFLVKRARWRQLIFRNNIWHGQAGGFNSWQRDLSPVDMKNDVVFSPSGYQVRMSGQDSGPGDKGNGVVLSFMWADPQLVNPGARDYRIGAGSPCLDRGVGLPGVNDTRAKGAAPDIGWHESGTELVAFGPAEGGRPARTVSAGVNEGPSKPAAEGKGLPLGEAVALLRAGKYDEAMKAAEALEAGDLSEDDKAACTLLMEACAATARLRKALMKAAAEGRPFGTAQGRRLRASVMMAGARMRGYVSSADDEGIAVVVGGDQVRLPWENLAAEEFGRLVRQLAGEEKAVTRDVVLFLAALGDEERAREIQAESGDTELGGDLKRLLDALPEER